MANDSYVQEYFAIELTLTVLSLLVVVIRFYVRFSIQHHGRPWWSYLSDVLLLVSWSCMAASPIVDAADFYGRGQKENAVQPWIYKWVYWMYIKTIIMYYSIKGAMLIFYAEWIPRSLPKHWLANRILMGINFACFLTCIGVYAFWCWPISRNWIIHPNPGGCYSNSSLPAIYCRFLLHIFTDILLFALPISVVHQMQNLSRRQKLEATGMFLLGGLNVIWAAWSVVSVWYPNGFSTFAIFLDATSGIFIFCLPALRLLVLQSWRYWRRNRPTVVADVESLKGRENVAQERMPPADTKHMSTSINTEDLKALNHMSTIKEVKSESSSGYSDSESRVTETFEGITAAPIGSRGS